MYKWDDALRDQLIDMYCIQGKTQAVIAGELGVNPRTVGNMMNRLGVSVRSRSERVNRRLGEYRPHLQVANEKKRIHVVEKDGVRGKDCRRCLLWRPLTEYHVERLAPYGLSYRCKECQRDRALAFYHANAERINELKRRPEQRARHRQWYREWERAKRRDDTNYRLAQRLRGRIRKALRRTHNRKISGLTELLGCSIPELRTRLEGKFAPGMTWANFGRGGWEIDHVRPVASYDLSDPEQQMACFHYSNLQPLWGPDNWSKSSKWRG